MRVLVCRSASAAATAAARDVAAFVRARPRATLGLPTGRTPVPFYAALVGLHRRGRVSFARAHAFNLDEFAGLAADDPGSYHSYLRRRLFDHVDFPPGHRHVFDGAARSARRQIAGFERTLDRLGGLDLAVLGIGLNGHLGFNEPAGVLASRTHRVRLSTSSRRANAWLFGGDVRRVPTEAFTMGIGTILAARRIVVLVTGSSKARLLRRALQGGITTRVPASLLQLHPDCTVILDRAASRHLAGGGVS